jgi:hypothetical protein
LYNPANVDPRIERGMLWDVWENIPGRLGSDFMRWAKAHGGEITVDGQRVLSGLSKVSVPACFFAGSVDWLAPEWTVRAGFDAWGRDVPGVEKHFITLGRAYGTRNDYGHCDISFGKDTPREVFEPAAQFLNHGALAQARPMMVSKYASEPEFDVASASPAE